MSSDSIILICKCKYFRCRSDGMRNGNLGGIRLSASVCHTDKHDSCLSRVKWGPGNTGAGPESQSALYVEATKVISVVAINSPSCLTSYHQVRQSPCVHGCSLWFQSRANQHVQLKHRSFGPQLRPWAICSETLFLNAGAKQWETQQVQQLAAQNDHLSSSPHGGRRKLTPSSCLLASTQVPWHECAHIQINKCN